MSNHNLVEQHRDQLNQLKTGLANLESLVSDIEYVGFKAGATAESGDPWPNEDIPKIEKIINDYDISIDDFEPDTDYPAYDKIDDTGWLTGMSMVEYWTSELEGFYSDEIDYVKSNSRHEGSIMSITLEKAFHNTEVAIPVIKTYENEHGHVAIVSMDSMEQAQTELCGMDDLNVVVFLLES